MTHKNITRRELRSFTLIEMLVVVAIIGILSGIVLLSLGGAITKANDTRIIEEMGQIRSAAAVYYSDNNYSYAGFNCDVTNPAMRPLCDDITARGGTNWLLNPDNSTGQAYCAKVKLNSGAWWCVDSQGRSAKYDTEPACVADSVYTCEP
jgi:prepilin-type N-terminal cleavage/methylation domain-containing protein